MAELENAMLTLAAISYCGYNLTLPEPVKSAHLRQKMTKLLNTLSPVKGQWDILWGPATFSAASPGFDDAAMYIARKLPFELQPPTYAIVVRGTNPISLTDWIFGDLMVARQVEWAYGKDTGGAKISLSTALGLQVLQHLRWEEGTSMVAAEQQGTIPDSAEAWTHAIRARLLSESVTGILQGLEEKLRPLAGANFDASSLFRRFEGHTSSPGSDLRSFLKQQVASSPGAVEIFVTGHSKGGALSSTLALWLADTQGTDVPPDDQWDPAGKATISAYSFAGPTAGNKAFAEHSTAVLKQRLHRIVNTKDVVPYAWSADTLKLVPMLYRLPDFEQLALQRLVARIVRAVEPLGYCQPGDATRMDPNELPDRPLLAQLIHQHLDGYFEEMGLIGEMSLATFFEPVI
jgi:ubiquinone biosynthesis protein